MWQAVVKDAIGGRPESRRGNRGGRENLAVMVEIT
jgi:hypothetical protein